MESLRACEFLFVSVLCSRGSATGGLCSGLLLEGLLLEGLLLEGLLLLITPCLVVEVRVVESGVEVNIADFVSVCGAAPF